MKFLLTWILSLGALAPSALLAAPFGAKDLAFILPPKGHPKVTPSRPYFEPQWLEDVDQAFRATSIEDAFLKESPPSDWRLVAVRLAPCQPLRPMLTPLNRTLCEMEIRLVWQPILEYQSGGIPRHYADDRAIHVLYRADPRHRLNESEAARYTDLQHRAESLTSAEMETYKTLHRRVTSGILREAQALRGPLAPDVFADLGERPEFAERSMARKFVENLQSFLRRHAQTAHLKELTAFSLPEGRQPPLLDEWVFVAFGPGDRGQPLRQKRLLITSRYDGRVLFDYGDSLSATMRQDDPKLHEALETLPPRDAAEIRTAVLLSPKDRNPQKSHLASGTSTHVSHTSCASCHKLKNPIFDLHNLSYFEDRELDPSPRVVQDVALDLEWLQQSKLSDPMVAAPRP